MTPAIFGVAALLLATVAALVIAQPCWLFRWNVVLRGNSATNQGFRKDVDVALTRWGARRKASYRNSGETGTGILKAEVERR